MARQNRTNKSQEDTMTTETIEAPVEETTETTTTEAPAEAPKAEIDLTEFKSAVEAAVAEADKTTGEVPAAVIAPVNEAYRKLDGLPAKNAARKHLDDQVLEAIGNLNAVAARSYSDLKGNLSAAGGSSATKTPADPTAAYVQKVAALTLALQLVKAGAPEGDDLDTKVENLVNESQAGVQALAAYNADTSEDKGEAPEATPVVRQAFKFAAGKSTGGGSARVSSGVRRDIAKHIQEAFADKASGDFLTIAEIAKFKSSEYGDDNPSQGAVSARLFPSNGKVSVDGVVPVERDEAAGIKAKGARKA